MVLQNYIEPGAYRIFSGGTQRGGGAPRVTVRACKASTADQRRQPCGGAEGLLLGSEQHREPLRQGDLVGVR
jgi:hypothetical protein